MTGFRFHSAAPDRWAQPRPTRDPAQARAIHGPLLPMEPERRGWLAKLVGKA
jgi:hypothetical protein